MLKPFRIALTLVLLMAVAGVNAQVTTSTLSGRVIDSTKEAVIGATIQAVHEPSGSRYGVVTNMDGRYTIQGMRTGGPYTVTISYIGYQTAIVKEISLQLGEIYTLETELKESSELLSEVVVTASRSKFANEKTGATTNISQEQMLALPTISRSISDMARVSPYANGMSFAGGDGRSTNFTIDGANFNNNFGLSSNLPGGGNPVSLDAIEEVQVVVAPFDVRQTNFVGGGINAITKSGTNTFKGTAYTYYRNQDMRGNRIDNKDLGGRQDENKKTYGFTLGGPIIKNKLFFFVNYEKEKSFAEIIRYRARQEGENAGGMVSRTLASDMEKVRNHLINKYNYDPGSYTDFPAEGDNSKILARIDWNITDRHHLSLRYNKTENTSWTAPNGNSSDTGYRLNNTDRVGPLSMSFSNSMYSENNNVESISADLNSRFTDQMSNKLLFTYTNIKDFRGSNSAPFPFIDIMYKDADGTEYLSPYMSAGYELFTYNNEVNNKITTITDNFTYYLGSHKLTAGFNYEHQFANNAYMRNGTAYYRYKSVDDFLSGAAPESFALTYGFNGNKAPNAQVTFNQIGFYLQDEWDITNRLKLNYGVRFDNLIFDDKDIERNTAIYDLDFGGKKVDTGKWADAGFRISPRVGFSWDVFGDKRLKVRGGTGLFMGRIPLVFFTNMPTNANLVQNSVQFKTTYANNVATGHDSRLDQLAGGMITDVDEIIKKFNLPTTIEKHTAGSKIAGIADDFKMPQVWKTSLAVDYQLPVSFPFTVTGEFMYTKNVNAVTMNNINIKDPEANNWERFSGADNRYIYPADYAYNKGKNAVILDNTSKGWGYTANITLNAQPIPTLDLMAAYTHTEMKEVSGMPGSDPVSAWQGLITVNGANFSGIQRSRYVVPDKLIASVNWIIPFNHNKLLRGTRLSLFYTGSSYSGGSYCYENDMNGDGVKQDLMYIPRNDSEIKFKTEDDRKAFWAFVEQDKYLKNHKGEYAEAYAARLPWVHKFDFRLVEDFQFKVGKTKHSLQLSFDILNVGNLLNSKWGVGKATSVCNGMRILKYEGKDAQNVPTFSMVKVNGEYPTKTWDTYQDYSQCWKLQVGVRYVFN